MVARLGHIRLNFLFFCFRKQKKIFVSVSASKNIFECFPKQEKIFFIVPDRIKALTLFPQIKIFSLLVSARKYIFHLCFCCNSILLVETKLKIFYLRKQKLKILLLAETKAHILFHLGKQKKQFLLLGKTITDIFTWRNKPNDFFLLGKTKIFFLLLGKQVQIFLHLGN